MNRSAKTALLKKNFYILGNKIKQFIDSNEGCIATDKITVDGRKVGFMYREKPKRKSR